MVEITADPDVLVERIVNRARESAATTGARADDNVEVVRNRLSVYRELTEPLVDYYRTKGLVRTVDGMKSVEEVTASIRRAAQLGQASATGAGRVASSKVWAISAGGLLTPGDAATRTAPVSWIFGLDSVPQRG